MRLIYGKGEPSLSCLPYEYIHKMNPFRVMTLHDGLEDKVGAHRAYLVSQMKAYPDVVFDIMKCSPSQLLELCKSIRLKDYGTQYDMLLEVIDLLERIDKEGGVLLFGKKYGINSYTPVRYLADVQSAYVNNMGQLKHRTYMRVIEKEAEDAEYLKEKKQYEEELKVYERHPAVVDKPLGVYKSYLYIEPTDIGRKLLAWYRENKAAFVEETENR